MKHLLAITGIRESKRSQPARHGQHQRLQNSGSRCSLSVAEEAVVMVTHTPAEAAVAAAMSKSVS